MLTAPAHPGRRNPRYGFFEVHGLVVPTLHNARHRLAIFVVDGGPSLLHRSHVPRVDDLGPAVAARPVNRDLAPFDALTPPTVATRRRSRSRGSVAGAHTQRPRTGRPESMRTVGPAARAGDVADGLGDAVFVGMYGMTCCSLPP